MRADKAALRAERAALTGPVPERAHDGKTAGMPLDRAPEWYASEAALRVARNIVSFQTPAGGWGKNVNRDAPPRAPGEGYVAGLDPSGKAGGPRAIDDDGWSYVGTIDNDATTTELRFLARVQAQFPGAAGDGYRAAFEKGVRYLLAAQFPNGGWPQVYPLQGGYHDALTFNDGAVADVATLMLSVAARAGDYGFVAAALAEAARVSAERACAVIVQTQVRIGGKPTIWGQQHDALTLAPAGARNFEPIAVSSGESAGLLLFLMRLKDPSPGVVAAVRDGVAWLDAHALHDVAWVVDPARGGRRLVAQPGAAPLWPRYYEIPTARAIFGDRDRSIHDSVDEISEERRNGYAWFVTEPRKAIEAYAKWSAKHASPQ
ncbi:pectate lyase [Sphingomonas hengshuiensis]|uniref:Pectate lyase n=2 Tax=Sphingomonas hengshuiensis TaxID=1609977 RepID=A0A7U5CV18_9SPHN|nr:pectate lyase [Sphingomonas hengshuiensis]